MKNAVTRRQFLLSFLKFSALGGVMLGGYGFKFEPSWLRHTVYNFASSRWPATHAPVKIAIATDFHVGCPSVNLARATDIVTRLNALNPDVTLLLGDYLIKNVVGGRYVAADPIADVLGGLKAKYGVYSVLGNHDWWKDGQGMWNALARNNIHVLENDALKLRRPDLPEQDFWIAGLADTTTRTPDIPKTMAAITDDDPVVMMSHNPLQFLEMPERPVITLSGHTHGGQIRLPFLPPPIMPDTVPRRLAYGHIIENDKNLIVSSGIGTSVIPLRLAMLPEIVTLNLGPA